MRLRFLGTVALAVLVLSACGDAAPPVLRVGSIGYTAAEVAPLGRDGAETLADLTAFSLAVADGRIDELGAPLIRDAERAARLDVLPLYLAARAAGVGPQELHEAYLADPEYILTVRHMVRLAPPEATDAHRAEQLAVAQMVRERAMAGDDFAALAAQYSEEPGAARSGGLLEPGRRGSWVDPFWDAARALQVGEVSPVVESPYGFHVLRLEARDTVPFEEADLASVLRRVVSPEQARVAMEEWVASRPPIILDPPAVMGARHALAEMRGDSTVIASGPQGDYTTADLLTDWTALDAERREDLMAAGDIDFARWVQTEVRDAFWARAARDDLGVEVPADAAADVRSRWLGDVARW
ncbi:MAG TPA: peptidylprolyl isomerase, partial [Longimicrobiaceae bacterium]|nr:peptidylprolyl isomerase [Longimicrobiaceae bacterium]